MSLPETTDPRRNFRLSLDVAHRLVDLGVPVFTGRLTPEGQPDRKDRRWDEWQKREPSHGIVDSWKPGLALCAVTGTTYDVLDYDPRNGGERSLRQLDKELGEAGPEVYWEVRTPNGGRHFWVAPLGIGKHTGFLPGLDLQGGKPDGSGRGFVYLPPTIRPALDGTRRPYRALRPLKELNGDKPSTEFRNWIENCLALKDVQPGTGSSRIAGSKLRVEVLKASGGEQRTALLKYVHELERKGYEREDIVSLLRALCGEMKNFDPRNPWYPARGGNPDKWILGLLHHPGRIVGDAAPDELEGIEPVRAAGLMRSFAEIERELVHWLWEGHLSFGELTVMDGEKGQGKSFVTIDVIARATRGLPMPGCEEAIYGPVNVIIFTDESNAAREIKPRLEAAGADASRIFCPRIRRTRGKIEAGLVLPDSAPMFARMIREVGAEIAVWDPITDFLAEDVQTHNDASVRRALRPIGQILAETNCAGWMLRHMNKDSGARAKFRGAGTTAFQNRARVHLITGTLPPGNEAKFGITVVDANLIKKVPGVLAYDIVDSDILADKSGNMVGKVEWAGRVEVDADILTGAKAARKGPREAPEQEQLRMVLEDMFEQQDTWPVPKAEEQLKASGCTTNRITVQKVRQQLGIRSIQIRKRGKVGVVAWAWTMRKDKISETLEDK